MATILLVEDDETLAEGLTELLEDEAFSIVWAADGEQALDLTFKRSFDLLLLDVNVPNLNGFELLQSLRDSGNTTPAIFITSLSDIASLSRGFDVGADDYIKKPFDFDELLVRINALLKRHFHTRNNFIEAGEFRYDLTKDELYKSDTFVTLTPSEKKIAAFFFKHLDTTLTKENILFELGGGSESSEGALRVYINKLRKIGLNIQTIKGTGYRLANP